MLFVKLSPKLQMRKCQVVTLQRPARNWFMCVSHVKHAYFSWCNPSNSWFVTWSLSLMSSTREHFKLSRVMTCEQEPTRVSINRDFNKLREQLELQNRTLRLVKCFAIILCLSRWTKWMGCTLLARHEWLSCESQEWVIYCRGLSLSSCRRLGDYITNLHQKACRTCGMIIFPHSTNNIIGL